MQTICLKSFQGKSFHKLALNFSLIRLIIIYFRLLIVVIRFMVVIKHERKS